MLRVLKDSPALQYVDHNQSSHVAVIVLSNCDLLSTVLPAERLLAAIQVASYLAYCIGLLHIIFLNIPLPGL